MKKINLSVLFHRRVIKIITFDIKEEVRQEELNMREEIRNSNEDFDDLKKKLETKEKENIEDVKKKNAQIELLDQTVNIRKTKISSVPTVKNVGLK